MKLPDAVLVTCSECKKTVSFARRDGRRRVTCGEACYRIRHLRLRQETAQGLRATPRYSRCICAKCGDSHRYENNA